MKTITKQCREFSLVHVKSTKKLSLRRPDNFVEQKIHAFFIRTSQFWPSLIVLKFLRNLNLNCS